MPKNSQAGHDGLRKIGQVLRNRREKLGTRPEVADEIGCSPNTLYRIEQGKEASVSTLLGICDHFKVQASEVLKEAGL